jgi:hypothetical protein
MKKRHQHHQLLGKFTLKLQRYTISHPPLWLKFKKTSSTNTSEDARLELELTYVADGSVKCYKYFRKSWQFVRKTKHTPHLWSSNFISACLNKWNTAYVHQKCYIESLCHPYSCLSQMINNSGVHQQENRQTGKFILWTTTPSSKGMTQKHYIQRSLMQKSMCYILLFI